VRVQALGERVYPAVICASVALVAGCGSSSAGDKAVTRDVRRGLVEIRAVHDRKLLQAKLTAIVSRLKSDAAASRDAKRARTLAIRGFEAKLTSVKAEREFYENDSGQVAEATIDAARADKYRTRADALLGQAAAKLGVTGRI